MAALDILKEAGKSAVGGLAKAVIEIEDARLKEINVKDEKNGSSSLIDINGDKLATFSSKNVNTIKEQLGELFSESSTKKQYVVRFNPSELSLSASGGENAGIKVLKTSLDGSAITTGYVDMDASIDLNVRLIIDDMDVEDCFMNEIVDAKGTAKKAVKAATKKKNSVQNQVEGFIAALRSPYTRRITFIWGKMSYKGVLNSVNAEYTMFSIQGRPVRAVVDLDIACLDEDISESNMGQWEDSFKKAFSTDKTNLESAGQNVGNLMNFNL